MWSGTLILDNRLAMVGVCIKSSFWSNWTSDWRWMSMFPDWVFNGSLSRVRPISTSAKASYFYLILVTSSYLSAFFIILICFSSSKAFILSFNFLIIGLLWAMVCYCSITKFYISTSFSTVSLYFLSFSLISSRLALFTSFNFSISSPFVTNNAFKSLISALSLYLSY